MFENFFCKVLCDASRSQPLATRIGFGKSEPLNPNPIEGEKGVAEVVVVVVVVVVVLRSSS